MKTQHLLTITIIALALTTAAAAQETPQIETINQQEPEEAVIDTEPQSYIQTEIRFEEQLPESNYQIKLGEEEPEELIIEEDEIQAQFRPIEPGQETLNITNQVTGESQIQQVQLELTDEGQELIEDGGEETENQSEELQQELPEDIEPEDLEEIDEEELQEVIDEQTGFEEQTINITEETEEIPGIVKWLVPEQDININVENISEEFPEQVEEQLPTEINIQVDNSLETVEIQQNKSENPTLDVYIEFEVIEDLETGADPDQEQIAEYLEEEKIELEPHGIISTLLVRTAEWIIT